MTDPAGKWKTFTTDAFGNLTTVTEPNPGGGTVATNYTYTAVNQLTQVSMTRGGNTQTRTFAWSGVDMVSATNPENGTVTYTYNGDHTVSTRTDAKGQHTYYYYDSYGRPYARYYYNANWQLQPDQTVSYGYVYSGAGAGQLASATFGIAGGGTMYYNYAYNYAGRATSQRVWMPTTPAGWQGPGLDKTTYYAWDYEGKLTGADNPAVPTPNGTRYQYLQYDQMGRPVSTTAYNPTTYQWDTVATASYGVAGEVTSLWTMWAGTETRTYNSLLQLTHAVVPGLMDNLSERSRMQYIYTAGQNNGRIAESIDGISGEDVQYTYDSLQRLVLAATTGSGGWGDAYTYDGFGNLTAKTVTKGSAPAMTAVYDAATNWPVGGNYDANGNAPIGTWSVENRLLSQTLDGVALTWGYDGSGQRIMQYQTVNGQPQWTFYLYDLQGRRMAQFVCAPSGTYPYNTVCTAAGAHVYFAGKLIAATDATGRLLGVTDRQGSVRASETNGTWTTASYYPYGEEKQPLAPDGMEKFGTYVRDSSLSGQDYAGQRYYSPNMGRFDSPDPGMDNVDFANPLTWNAYSYVNGDPINFSDPDGLETCGEQPIDGGAFSGQTLSQVMTGTSGNDLLAQIIWHEGGTIYSSDLANPTAYQQDLAAIGTAVLNQWDVDHNRLKVYLNGTAVCPLGQCLGRSLQEVIIDIATYYDSGGNLVHTFDSSGHMQDAAASTLKSILSTDVLAPPLVLDNGLPTNQDCEGVIASLVHASNLLDGSESRVSPNGLTLLFWNRAPDDSTTTFPGNKGYTGWRDSRVQGETFWGLSSTPPPAVRRPLPPAVRRRIF